MDDNPVVVSPKLAVLLGLEAAVFMQQVHYWQRKNQGQPVYNTVAAWCAQLPFIGKSTLERIIRNLKEKGVLRVKIIAINNLKTGLYSIDYFALEALTQDDLQTVNLTTCKNANEEMQTLNLTECHPQNDGMQTVNLTGLNTIQRINTETTTESKAHSRSARPKKDKVGLSIEDLVAKGIDRQIAIDWFAVRRDKRSQTLTITALAAIEREASAAGMSLEAAIRTSAESGWVGFKTSWLQKRDVTGSSQKLSSKRHDISEIDYAAGVQKDGRF